MALYGNLTLSYLTERPHGAPERTTHVHTRDEKGMAYDAALAALRRGEQVYVICPLVGERAKGGESAEGNQPDADEYAYGSIAIEDDVDMAGDDVAAAEAEASFLQAKVFVDYNVGLVHGKLSAAEKQEAMRAFAAGETHVLVATTVIEVGVDVPNATVLIVEDADRFGLAQLHQLRGRVGRGSLPSEVHLISNSKNETAHKRLAVMETTDNGFELASYDLSLRREGDILGNRQHGASLLKLVNVVRDASIVEAARADAEAILEEDPELALPAHQPLAREARVVYRHDSAITGG
jgi:ATP-dependent DNA helicase RecG